MQTGIQAVENDDFDSYWTESSAAESLMEYISQDFNGLTASIAGLVGGVEVRLNTAGFANDLTTFKGKGLRRFIMKNPRPSIIAGKRACAASSSWRIQQISQPSERA